MTNPTPAEAKSPQAQAQAEAMALMIRNSESPSRVLIETLSKLIEENERLVNDSRNDCARYDDIAAKLTATEAKLEIGKKWMEHSEYCQSQGEWKPCSCGLSAFLSTLTAEKKEEGK